MFAVAVLPRTAGGGACEGGHLGAVSEYECGGGHFVEVVGPAGGVWGGGVGWCVGGEGRRLGLWGGVGRGESCVGEGRGREIFVVLHSCELIL